MANRQIHELDARGTVSLLDETDVSTATTNLTRRSPIAAYVLAFILAGVERFKFAPQAEAVASPTDGDVVASSTWNGGQGAGGLYARLAGGWWRISDYRMRGWAVVNRQTGTSYTIDVPLDLGDEVVMAGATSKAVTVPQVAAVPGTTGAPGATTIVTGRTVYVETLVTQEGAGGITLSPASGLTITGPVETTDDAQSLVLRWTSATAVSTRLLG